MEKIKVSTPSRVCLFGEHQDYLGLEVIAQAIDLRFYAEAEERKDKVLNIKIGSKLFDKSSEEFYQWVSHKVDFSREIVYENKRDYMKSIVSVLIKEGYDLKSGYDITMVSEIPIGKGMCSSSTMIIALIKVLLEAIGAEDKDNPERIAYLGFLAEVKEFNEPGGMMDHYSSALGGLVNLNFENGQTKVSRINKSLPGKFILFDSLRDKDTTNVLATAKYPVVSALKKLEGKGITSVKDFVFDDENFKYLDLLEHEEKRNLVANVDNFKILQKAKDILLGDEFCEEKFGELLKKHHANLRDGLKISTPEIEAILSISYLHGALGGKVNGSGGGGCCFVYVKDKDCERVLKAVNEIGYPGRIVDISDGVRREVI